MNILIINQPTCNRGDEAAHRALVRTLAKACPDDRILVLFIGENPTGVSESQVDLPNVSYENIPMRRGVYQLPNYVSRYRLDKFFVHLHPAYRSYRRRIRNADVVISAPSGISLGLFRDWRYLLCARQVVDLGKPFAYYSPSFGPAPSGRKGDRLFWTSVMAVLKNFRFLSIRDRRTMELAGQLGLHYTPSIDTAFLESPGAAIPDNILGMVGDTPYAVFVPNSLIWHVAYKNKADPRRIEIFYRKALDMILEKVPGEKVVLLPQLYGLGPRGDANYFRHLRQLASAPDRVVALDENYGSDIQQAIISKSRFVVGARYHSIVFAINNATPFVSLSYEHKMDGLLELLGLADRAIDIRQLGFDTFSEQEQLGLLGKLLDNAVVPAEARDKAKQLAMETFTLFRKTFLLQGE